MCGSLNERLISKVVTTILRMPKNSFALACAAGLCAPIAGCSTTASETAIQESQVPAPVLTEFRQPFPKARITCPALEKGASHRFDELATDGKGTPYSHVYTPSSKLAETEIEFPFAQRSAVVWEAAQRASPAGNVELTEIAQKRGKTHYAVHFKEDGWTLVTVFDPAGNLVNKDFE